MRVAALPVLIASFMLQATRVRSIHVPAPRPELAPCPHPGTTSSEEQEEPDDEFQVRLTPDEVTTAASGGVLRHARLGSEAGCPILNLQSEATRKFYFLERIEGLGSRIDGVIGALMYAEKNNLRFAGVLTKGLGPTSHWVNISLGMQAFFGFAHASDFYVTPSECRRFSRECRRYPELPNETQRFSTLDLLSEQLAAGAIGDGASVCADSGTQVGNVGVVSETLLKALRSKATPLMRMPLSHFLPGRVNVAVHVRRGDVNARTPARGTPDDYYFWLMDIVREKAPEAEFHVFSEKPYKRKADGEDIDIFEEYRKWGANVHVDTEARETLAHMARADVLLTAKSSFSYVAAFLNPNCVLHQPWKMGLEGWVRLPKASQKGNMEGERIAQEIVSCMRKMKEMADRDEEPHEK
jgi:hypothetical protein